MALAANPSREELLGHYNHTTSAPLMPRDHYQHSIRAQALTWSRWKRIPAKNASSVSASLWPCSKVRAICLLFTSCAQSNARSSIVSSTNASAAMGLVCCASSSAATYERHRTLRGHIIGGGGGGGERRNRRFLEHGSTVATRCRGEESGGFNTLRDATRKLFVFG